MSFFKSHHHISSSSCLLLFLLLLLHNISESKSSIIKNLPGYPDDLPFKLRTGYVGLTEHGVELFYYFIESETNSPEDDPLILWLTGGPGCSALSGLAYEVGPFTFDFESPMRNLPKLLVNPYSWTKVAHMIFLDQPVNTGFSYATTDQGMESSDTIVVQQIYSFLQEWFERYPEFLTNRLYLGGDSYSGKIVPMAVQRISSGNEVGREPRMNLKGYMIGNPYTDSSIDENSRIQFAYMKGLISFELYQSLERNCKGDYINVDPENGLCKADLQDYTRCTEKINGVHILEPKCKVNHVPKPTIMDDPVDFILSPTYNASSTPWCRSHNMVYVYTWANNKDVQKALGIREGTVNEWLRCNRTLSYQQDVASSFPYHQNLTNKGYQVLVFSGDQDMLFPHVGTEKWIKNLNLSTDYTWQPWFYEGQVAGYSVGYVKDDYHLTFVTVKGAGHTAPEYKPEESLAMIYRWLTEYPL